jgi:hypothetical protein
MSHQKKVSISKPNFQKSKGCFINQLLVRPGSHSARSTKTSDCQIVLQGYSQEGTERGRCHWGKDTDFENCKINVQMDTNASPIEFEA